MDPTVPSTNALLTFGGLTVFVTAVTEIILRAWRPAPATQDRFGPLLALVVGVVAAVAAAIWLNDDVFQALILGVLVAFAGMGLHDTASTVA